MMMKARSERRWKTNEGVGEGRRLGKVWREKTGMEKAATLYIRARVY